jgi:hypothetical protein
MMAINISDIKKRLQEHLQEGLLIVVGTGLSIAEGLPGMIELASHLKKVVPTKLSITDPNWNKVVDNLDSGKDLENALSDINLLPSTIDIIIQETALLVSASEYNVFKDVISGKRTLPFTNFVKHLFKAGKKFHLITPNYDRLIELATEFAGIGIDTRFNGYLIGQMDPKRSADAHRESFISGRNKDFRPLPCLNVYKPHGSLDWYEFENKIIRSPVTINKLPIIITPGISKYRESFRRVIDDQRNAGNRAVTNAKRFLFIGYGFNDDHLEQYLCPNLQLIKPSVIITKKLTENAKKLISNNKNVDLITLTAHTTTESRTNISTPSGDELVVDEALWNLEGFLKGVI